MVDSGTGQTVQALLDERLVTDEQVAAATESAGRSGRTALQELLDAGIVGREQVVRTAATAAGLRYVDVSEYVVNASAAATLPADFARRSTVLPLTWEDGELLVAVGIRQAGNIELKDDLTRLTKSRVRFAVANRSRHRRARSTRSTAPRASSTTSPPTWSPTRTPPTCRR